MNKFLNEPLLRLPNEAYLTSMVLMAPLLNFLAGISIDLYAPSLPAIAHYYAVSESMAKNTITITMLGFAFGCTLFGTLIDVLGRRKIILAALLVFILVSALAPFSENIYQLMIIRFIQGMVMSTASIGSRALVVDNFTDRRFSVVVLYTSMAYAMGPAIAPFIGGLLQYYFNWKANFIAYAIFGVILIIPFFVFVRETLKNPHPASLRYALLQYQKILTHRHFMAGVLILSGVLIEQMIYPTLGPFLVEKTLGFTPMVYGNTAFVVGVSYLCGTLVNRIFIHKITQRHLLYFGLCALSFATLLQLCFALVFLLNLFTVVFPLTLVGFSLGFIFPNVLGACLKFFPDCVGTASAVQAFALMVIGALGVFIMSCFSIHSLLQLSVIYILVVSLQLGVFFFGFRTAVSVE